MLRDRHYEVYIVDAGPGVDFGKLVNGYLHKIKKKEGVLLAVCTETYGEKTASQYSTFEELTYADSWGLQVVPLKMTDVYPPRPQHEAAKELIDKVFKPSLSYLDCVEKSDEWIANKIAAVLRQ